MGKALGTFFRLLFTLLILLAVGYNTWQVSSLRAEVDALKRQRARAIQTEKAMGGETVAANTDSLLARARKHAEQARAFLRKNQYAPAQRELAEAAQALHEASRGAQEGSRSALGRLRDTLRGMSENVDALWGGKERTNKK